MSDQWLCICGTWNAPEGKICHWCDAERVFSEARAPERVDDVSALERRVERLEKLVASMVVRRP